MLNKNIAPDDTAADFWHIDICEVYSIFWTSIEVYDYLCFLMLTHELNSVLLLIIKSHSIRSVSLK